MSVADHWFGMVNATTGSQWVVRKHKDEKKQAELLRLTHLIDMQSAKEAGWIK